MDMEEKINISITGEEKDKSEIVYNNIIENMKLSKDQQVRYLKDKVTRLEVEMRNRMVSVILIILSILGMGFGIYFMTQNLYLLGSIIIIGTFVGVMIRFYFMYRSILRITRSMEFDKIEHLRRILSMRLK